MRFEKECGPCSGNGYYGFSRRDTCEVCHGLGLLRLREKDGPNPVIGITKSAEAVAKYDLFIAHASEDKAFVTPLAKSLVGQGLRIWYDDFVLRARMPCCGGCALSPLLFVP